MNAHATGTFEGKSWNEQPFHEIEGGPKLARASVTNSYHGDVEGEGTLEYLFIYQDDSSASFIGVERVVGRVGDRSGSLVLQQSGTYEAGTAKGTWFVVPGSGTGELRGMKGEGGFIASHGQNASFTLDYDVE